MDRITRFALKNAAAIIIVAVLAIAGGIYSASQLKRETMPDINIPVVAIVTPYPGAAPNDVYANVTKPMEQALNGVVGVEKVQSTSADSVSAVIAQFSFSADMDKAEANVKKAIEGVKLPVNTVTPQIKRISFGSAPVLKMAITGGASEAQLRAIARDTVVPGLTSVAGVGEASIASDYESAVRIEFDAKKLRKHGLTVSGVTQQLQAANLSFPVGAVDVNDVNQPVRVSGTLGTIDDIKNFSIPVYPNTNAMFGSAFASIGKGFGALGGAIGQLGAGMGELGAGMGQLGQGVGGVAGLQQLQGMLVQLEIPYSQAVATNAAAQSAYTRAQAIVSDPTTFTAGGPSEHDRKTAQASSMEASMTIKGTNAQMAAMAPQIAYVKAAITSLQGSLSGLQSSGGSGGSSSSGGSSGGGGSMSTGASMPAAKIKLVKLSDVATVTYGPGDVVGSRASGKPAVLIDIIKTQDANTVDVSKGVRAEMEKLSLELPAGAKVEYAYDASVGINASVDGMVREGLLGALFAFVVILLFLRNWRSTIIAVVSIPMSIVIALVALKFTGVTLNVMTLGGLTVAIGRVVDDSIVVIENIYRHLSLGEPRTPETIRKAVSEVSSAITSSTITTVAVFLPLGLVTGIIGKIFRPFAITVGIALLASLLVAVTIVPLMAKWTLLRSKVKREREGDTKIQAWYKRTLGWALEHKAIVLSASLVLLVGSLALVPLIGTGFVPESKEKYVNVVVEYPEGTKAITVDKTIRTIERELSQEKAVLVYNTSVGSAGGFDLSNGVTGTNRGSLFVKLDSGADTRQVVSDMRTKFKAIDPAAKITVSAQSAAGGNSTIEAVVTGRSIADIRTGAQAVTKALEGMDGLENVSNNLGQERKQIAVTVNEKKAAKQGLNAAMVAGTVRSLVAEQSLGTVKIDDKDAPILYSLKLAKVQDITQIRNITLDTPLGKKIKLSKIASVVETGSPVSVLTKDGAEYASVGGTITSRDTGSVITAVKAKVATVKLPEGVKVEVGGTAEQMNESFSQLGIAMIIAIGAVYLVMVLAFGEAVAPLAIMFSLPLAIIGGLLGLFVMKLPLDIPALIGALMLIGIVVTNAIVLVELVQQKREQGESINDALKDAGATRMRPILMTALATIFALVPLASGFAEGALISQSLAVIVIGGLTTSTALTLVVVPVAYALLEGWREKLLGKRHETPEGDGPDGDGGKPRFGPDDFEAVPE